MTQHSACGAIIYKNSLGRNWLCGRFTACQIFITPPPPIPPSRPVTGTAPSPRGRGGGAEAGAGTLRWYGGGVVSPSARQCSAIARWQAAAVTLRTGRSGRASTARRTGIARRGRRVSAIQGLRGCLQCRQSQLLSPVLTVVVADVSNTASQWFCPVHGAMVGTGRTRNAFRAIFGKR